MSVQSEITRISNEVASQSELLEQLRSILASKATKEALTVEEVKT